MSKLTKALVYYFGMCALLLAIYIGFKFEPYITGRVLAFIAGWIAGYFLSKFLWYAAKKMAGYQEY